MFKVFSILLYTVPLILAWIYLLVAVFVVLIQVMRLKKEKLGFGVWIYLIANCVYILAFAITRIFFFEVWEMVFSALGLVALCLSACWSRYEDKRKGQRWWEW